MEQIKQTLQHNPELLLRTRLAVDGIGRKFNCYPLHYVLWARDKKIYELIVQCLNALPQDNDGYKIRGQVLNQYRNFIRKGITYTSDRGQKVTELFHSIDLTAITSAPDVAGIIVALKTIVKMMGRFTQEQLTSIDSYLDGYRPGWLLNSPAVAPYVRQAVVAQLKQIESWPQLDVIEGELVLLSTPPSTQKLQKAALSWVPSCAVS